MRDEQDRWVRVHTRAGDLVVLPEGIYHRFTLDEGDYIKAGVGGVSRVWGGLREYGRWALRAARAGPETGQVGPRLPRPPHPPRPPTTHARPPARSR